jgi:hypothetical protein
VRNFYKGWWIGVFIILALIAASAAQAQTSENNSPYWATYQKIYLNPNEGASVRQVTIGFTVFEQGTTGRVSINNSYQGAQGVFTINQVGGNLNKLATTISYNEITGNSPASLLPIMYTSIINNNTIYNYGNDYRAVLGGNSFKGAQGIVAINQVVGNINHSFTSVGVSMTGAPGMAMTLDNLSLSDVTAQNAVQTLGGSVAEVRIDSGAFQDFKGVGTVTQVAGNLNQVANRISLRINP